MEPNHSNSDERIDNMDDPNTPSSYFKVIFIDELLQTLLNNAFCDEIRKILNNWEMLSFFVDDNGILVSM